MIIVSPDQQVQCLNDISTLLHQSYNNNNNNKNNEIDNNSNCKTYIIPSIQYSPIGMNMGEIIFNNLLKLLSENKYNTTLATAYLNYSKEVLKILSEYKGNIELQTATPYV